MYKCEICGLVFDEPYIDEYSEPRPDGFRERFRIVSCPACFEPYFREIESEESEDDHDSTKDL